MRENKSAIIYSRFGVPGVLTIIAGDLPSWCRPLLRKDTDGTYKTIHREDDEQEIFVLPLCCRPDADRKVGYLPPIPTLEEWLAHTEEQ